MRRQCVLGQRPSVVGGGYHTHCTSLEEPLGTTHCPSGVREAIAPDICVDLLHSCIHTLHHAREPVLHELVHLLHEYLVHALVKNARLDPRAVGRRQNAEATPQTQMLQKSIEHDLEQLQVGVLGRKRASIIDALVDSKCNTSWVQSIPIPETRLHVALVMPIVQNKIHCFICFAHGIKVKKTHIWDVNCHFLRSICNVLIPQPHKLLFILTVLGESNYRSRTRQNK